MEETKKEWEKGNINYTVLWQGLETQKRRKTMEDTPRKSVGSETASAVALKYFSFLQLH